LTFSPACSAFTCDTATAAGGELTRRALLISPTAEASCHPDPAAAVAPFNARAFLAARGQPTSGVVPDPSSTLVRTVVPFHSLSLGLYVRVTHFLSIGSRHFNMSLKRKEYDSRWMTMRGAEISFFPQPLLNSLSAKSVLAGEKLVATYSIST
jgi:hypothetical protein